MAFLFFAPKPVAKAAHLHYGFFGEMRGKLLTLVSIESKPGGGESMSRVNRLGAAAIIGLAFALSSVFAGGVTVGRFYTEIAQAKRMTFVDAASAETKLRSAGYYLPHLALDKVLTEGDMTAISGSIGIDVTTHQPSQLVSEAQLNTYMTSFRGQLGAFGARPADPYRLNDLPPPSGNGNGKKKGHHKSTSEPF